MAEMTGTCLTMCPEEEVQLREKNALLHPFEVLPETAKHRLPKADRCKMVKEYTRPAAGKELVVSTLRPAPVLLKTVAFLMNEVVSQRDDVPWWKVYEYVFDRLRAVRQDMVIQRIEGPTAMSILETAVRFYIFSAYALCEENRANFDAHINNTHAQECLKRLLVLYANADVSTKEIVAEFVSLYLVENLGNSEALHCGLSWKRRLDKSDIFNISLQMSLAAWLGNAVRVFKLAARLPTIHLCSFHKHMNSLRSDSLKAMSSGFHSKNLRYSLDDLTRLFWFNSADECERFCQAHGLPVTGGGVVFSKTNFRIGDNLAKKKLNIIEGKVAESAICAILTKSVSTYECDS